MRRIDLARGMRGVLFAATCLNSLNIGLSLQATCQRVNKTSCFLSNGENVTTLNEYCENKYSKCPEPDWKRLLEVGKPRLYDLECALVNLQFRGYSQSSMASMIHMRQIVQSLKDDSKIVSIDKLKKRIEESIEILKRRSKFSPDQNFLSPIDKTHKRIVTVGLNIGGIDVSLKGHSEFLISSAGKTKFATLLTDALMTLKKSHGKNQLKFHGFDEGQWFSDDKQIRIQYRNKVVTHMINSELEKLERKNNSGKQGKEIHEHIYRTITKLEKLLIIKSERDFYAQLSTI